MEVQRARMLRDNRLGIALLIMQARSEGKISSRGVSLNITKGAPMATPRQPDERDASNPAG